MDNSFKKLSSANASVIMEGLDEIGKEVFPDSLISKIDNIPFMNIMKF